MDKKTFCYILESALLNFDGVEIEELTAKYNIPKSLAKAGINLCSYLKSLKLNAEVKQNEEHRQI
jgi:hypothetical protein